MASILRQKVLELRTCFTLFVSLPGAANCSTQYMARSDFARVAESSLFARQAQSKSNYCKAWPRNLNPRPPLVKTCSFRLCISFTPVVFADWTCVLFTDMLFAAQTTYSLILGPVSHTQKYGGYLYSHRSDAIRKSLTASLKVPSKLETERFPR
jgi:hypothetical protein